MDDDAGLRIEPARESDTPVVLRMIKALVDYERLSHELTVTESMLRQALFGAQPAAEVVLGYVGTEPVGFAVYFPTFSTASGRTGLYLEDLYVEPQWRGRGFGRRLLAHVAMVAVERGGAGLSWSVLDWNESAIRFYRSVGAEQVRDSLSFRLVGKALERLGVAARARLAASALPVVELEIDGRRGAFRVTPGSAGTVFVQDALGELHLEELPRFPEPEDVERAAGGYSAPMPGTVLDVRVRTGDAVTRGQALLTMEAMKMEHLVTASADGVVAEVRVASGQQVDAGQVLIVIAVEPL